MVTGSLDAAVIDLCYADVGPRFECAVAALDSKPRGATISIALARLPATDPRRRIGSLFLNPGGPGGSGVDFVLGAGPFLSTDESRARFDLVGFDPRGFMRSTPLRCFDSPEEWPPFPPIAFPLARAEERRDGSPPSARWTVPAASVAARSGITCRRRTWRATWTSCAIWWVTEELHLRRRVLRLLPRRDLREPVPHRVRALVVDGVLEPRWPGPRAAGSRASWSRSRPVRSDAGAQATLNEFFRLCDAGGAALRLSPAPPHATRRSPAECARSRSRSPTRTARPRPSTTRS